MIPATYWCRDLDVRVMSSDSFDGEYTGRIMQKFGFVKVRYRGLAKNAHRLLVTAALANLYMARSYLLRRGQERCAC